MTFDPGRPPVAPRKTHTWTRPGGSVEDDYAWLADRTDPDVVPALEAENAHAAAWFGNHDDVVEQIFAEIKSRVVEDDSSPPVLHRGWWYSSRTEEGREYAIHGRGPTPERAFEHTLLDENVLAGGHEYFRLGAFDVDPTGTRLAWSSDTDGGERCVLRIRDIDHRSPAWGRDTDRIENTSADSVAWSADGGHLFYVSLDDAMRPWQVWRHVVGSDASADEVVYEEHDERFFVGVELTRSGRWILIESGSRTSSECRVIPADAPRDEPRLVRPRRDDVEYALDHWGDRFIVVTNEGAEDFRVCLAPENDPGEWEDFVDHVPGQRIVGFDCFDGHAVMQRWMDAQQTVALVDRTGTMTPIVVSDEPHEVELEANPDFDTDTVRLAWQSLTHPPTIVTHDISTGTRTVLKTVDVPGVDLADYVSERRWAAASDGTKVPVDVVRRRDSTGPAPCLLYAYGAYEVSLPPWFSVARLSLLDRGWVWALAHPRGGGEFGRGWYNAGKLLAKRNTFDDTVSCARHLVGSGVASRTVLRGGSAGGLLAGACMTAEPSEFAGIVAEVPFVDVVTTMSDPSLPLTVTEWEEWGDPRSEPFASYMASYSPYDNIRAVRYPPTYVTAGLNDPRVSYHEPAKFVARLRALSPDTHVLFSCEMGAGHGGPSGRYGRWRDEARTLTFVLLATG